MSPAHGETRPPSLLEVESFEHLSASRERVLLRVDGRYVDRPGKRILEATLFVDDGLAIRRHASLADPAKLAEEDVPGWLWRVAFDVPASYLTDARTSFALEPQPGVMLDLGDPRAVAVESSSTPLSERALFVARRYAAAIAAIVAIAVTPGVLPASARTEILKVRRPDGSIVYLAADGSPVTTIPAGADIIDETGSSAPSDTPPPAAGSSAQTGSSTQTVSSDGAAPAPRKAPAAQPKPKPKPKRVTVRQTDATPPRHAAAQPGQQPQASTDVQRPTDSTPRHARPGRHVPGTAPAAEPVTIPENVVRAAGPAPALRPLNRIGAGRIPASQPLRPLGSLVPLSAPPFESSSTLQSDSVTTAPPLKSPPVPAAPPLEPAPVAAAPPLQQPAAPQQPPAAVDAVNAAPPLRSSSQQSVATDAVDGAPPLHQVTPPATSGGHAQPRSHGRALNPAAPSPAKPATPTTTTTPSSGGTTTSSSSPAIAASPTPFSALPGPANEASVPSFVIDNFQIPPFLLPIYQAAATQYGIRWEVLAAINEIETNFGRDLSVSSAGALGWMQFMPETWATYGVDANRDGRRDPYNPVDAIFAAARYLKAAGGDKDVRQGIFAYNHAGWYVDSVMLRAQLIAAYPPELISALSGLTQGRFPIAAPARYAGEVTPGKPQAQPNSTTVASDSPTGTDIYTSPGAPVIAVNDGVVRRIGRSRTKGLYVVLQDAYGNEYTYSGLGSIASSYPVPNVDAPLNVSVATDATSDPTPHAAATGGSQTGSGLQGFQPAAAPAQPVATKQRLFAHPSRPDNRSAGGSAQVFNAQRPANGFETYNAYFADSLPLDSTNSTLEPLRPGVSVVASTILGHAATPAQGDQATVHFEIRPAGKNAPQIDPRPVLDGWRLLDSTQVFGPSAKGAQDKKAGPLTIGEIMLLPKALLEQRVLTDKRIRVYAAGREAIKAGQIDRRVLEVLEYLAESGLNPTVSGLHATQGTSPSVVLQSEQSMTDSVDISAINGTPIAGHQDSGGVAEQAVRQLMQLQGTLKPSQIISLLHFGQNTVAQPDHSTRIEVAFQPLFGDNAKLGKAAQFALGPTQWSQLAQRLGQISNPAVPIVPSKFALPDG